MSCRQVLWSWLIAGGLLLVSVMGLRAAMTTAPPAFHNATIAVIGSSQARYAVPRNGSGAASLKDDGEPFWRYGLSAISEPETVNLANRALDEKARLVIVEVNALIFDNDQTAARGRCDQPARRLRIALKNIQLSIATSWIHAARRDGGYDDGGEPENFLAPRPIDPAKSRNQIPSHLRGPCDREALISLTKRARQQGTRLIFIAPPRSAAVDRLIGVQKGLAIDRAEHELAKELNVPLFAPVSPWPDNLYISVGHFDVSGRIRFMGELRDFLRLYK